MKIKSENENENKSENQISGWTKPNQILKLAGEKMTNGRLFLPLSL